MRFEDVVKHVSSRHLFYDPHLTTQQSNVSPQLRRVAQEHPQPVS